MRVELFRKAGIWTTDITRPTLQGPCYPNTRERELRLRLSEELELVPADLVGEANSTVRLLRREERRRRELSALRQGRVRERFTDASTDERNVTFGRRTRAVHEVGDELSDSQRHGSTAT